MDLVLTHFWLFCGLWVGGIGAVYYRYKLRNTIYTEELSGDEIVAFTKGWALAVIIPCTMLWILQLTAGPASQPDFTSWPSPQKWIATGITILCWIAILYWVWIGNGAVILSRMVTLTNPKCPEYLFSPTAIKILSVAVVASGIYSLSISWADLTP